MTRRKMNLTISLRPSLLGLRLQCQLVFDRVFDRCSLLVEFDQRRCAIKKLGLKYMRLTVLFVASLWFASAAHAEEFRLICKWDDTNELQAIRVVGEGARLENEYDVIETHTPDYILIQRIRVDPRTGKPLGNGSDEHAGYVSWMYQFNRWTGRVVEAQAGRKRFGSCKRALERLF